MTVQGRELPKASIMIPTYNQAGIVSKAIESALMQDYPALEVILADDASSDTTQQVASSYLSDPRFRYIRHQRNCGRVGNYRRTLYEFATGDWILNLDGDDYLIAPDFVKMAITQAQSHKNVALIFGGCRILDDSGFYRDFVPTRQLWESLDGFEYFLSWGVYLGVPHSAALYLRDLALKVDFYRSNIISSDWESLRRLVLHGSVLMYGQVVSVWCQSASSASRSTEFKSRIADLQSIMQPYRYAVERGFDKTRLEFWRQETIASYVVNYFRMCLPNTDLRQAFAFLSHIEKNEPTIYRKVIKKVCRDWRLMGLGLLYSCCGQKFVDRLYHLGRGFIKDRSYGVASREIKR